VAPLDQIPTHPIDPDEASPRLFRIDLDTDPAGERLAAWGAALPAFDIAADSSDLFAGAAVVYMTERLSLIRASMAPVRLVRGEATIARVPLTHFAVKLTVAGGFHGTAEQRAFAAGPGDVLLLDLLRSVDMRSEPHRTTEAVSLWFPRARLQPALNSDEGIHGLVLKGDRAAGALIGASLTSFAAHAPEMTLAEMDIFGGAVIALFARAIVPELRAGDQSIATVPIRLNAVRHFIDQNLLSRDLEVDLIAANFGLSRASLYRLFAPIGGIAVYIRKQRLERAFQEIVSAEYSNRRIAGIAQRCGFENESAFTRLFRKTYGVTPSAARKAAAQGRAIKTGETGNAADTVADWLARLHP
jgi:AraC-like DNA-binding protein